MIQTQPDRSQLIAAARAVVGEFKLREEDLAAGGVVLALVLVVSPAWLREPTLLPALIFGVVTVAIPFFIMQPSFGLGVAAAKTPNPTVARLRSLMTHAVFGLGLYVSAWALSFLLNTSA